MQKHHLNKILIWLAVIAIFGLAAGILTGRHGPGRLSELPRIEHNARPQRPPEIVGKIESVVGNQIMIAKLEQPKTEERIDPAEWQKLSTEEKVKKFEERLNAFTGENVTVEIPAGIEITRRSPPPSNLEGVRKLAKTEQISSEGGENISPVAIHEGDFVAIWLDGKIVDQNVAEFINLIFTDKNAASE
ncbi:MAG: hypothetical protein V2A63_00335 [Patescibacteria group bacterium]